MTWFVEFAFMPLAAARENWASKLAHRLLTVKGSGKPPRFIHVMARVVSRPPPFPTELLWCSYGPYGLDTFFDDFDLAEECDVEQLVRFLVPCGPDPLSAGEFIKKHGLTRSRPRRHGDWGDLRFYIGAAMTFLGIPWGGRTFPVCTDVVQWRLPIKYRGHLTPDQLYNYLKEYTPYRLPDGETYTQPPQL